MTLITLCSPERSVTPPHCFPGSPFDGLAGAADDLSSPVRDGRACISDRFTRAAYGVASAAANTADRLPARLNRGTGAQ